MGSLQGSTLSTNVAGFVDGSSAPGFVDGSSARNGISHVDSLPVYFKELIAGGAAGAFAKTAVTPLERIKILLQIAVVLLDDACLQIDNIEVTEKCKWKICQLSPNNYDLWAYNFNFRVRRCLNWKKTNRSWCRIYGFFILLVIGVVSVMKM